jgi:uncharacterized protein (DUF302 family)
MIRPLAALLLTALPATAQEMVSYTTDQSFDDVIFGLENAIIDEGLQTEHVSHVGEMLARTGADVGSDVALYEAAEVYSFCSALLSRQAMEADPLNIGYCPYEVFVMQPAGSAEVTIGYRSFPEGPMQEVQALLDRIAKTAIGME